MNFSSSFYNYLFKKVIDKLEPDTAINSDTFFNTNHICEIPVLNGILNLKTRELMPFSPDKVFFSKINAEYKSKAKCVKIDNFLKEVLANEEDVKVFYEMVGFCLLKDYAFEKAFRFL